MFHSLNPQGLNSAGHISSSHLDPLNEWIQGQAGDVAPGSNAVALLPASPPPSPVTCSLGKPQGHKGGHHLAATMGRRLSQAVCGDWAMRSGETQAENMAFSSRMLQARLKELGTRLGLRTSSWARARATGLSHSRVCTEHQPSPRHARPQTLKFNPPSTRQLLRVRG